MCAEIHDGQERCSTKGRIHVRKTNFAISKSLLRRTAGPYTGSKENQEPIDGKVRSLAEAV